jgi:hypothetical protein
MYCLQFKVDAVVVKLAFYLVQPIAAELESDGEAEGGKEGSEASKSPPNNHSKLFWTC